MVDASIITKLRCNYCHYEWYPRTPNLPIVCPRCKHRNWNEEVKDVKKKGRSTTTTTQIKGGD